MEMYDVRPRTLQNVKEISCGLRISGPINLSQTDLAADTVPVNVDSLVGILPVLISWRCNCDMPAIRGLGLRQRRNINFRAAHGVRVVAERDVQYLHARPSTRFALLYISGSMYVAARRRSAVNERASPGE